MQKKNKKISSENIDLKVKASTEKSRSKLNNEHPADKLKHPKNSQEQDPLNIYLKEIRSTRILTVEEERRWARILCKSKEEKIKLLKKALGAIASIQHNRHAKQLLLLSNESLFENIYLKEPLYLYKKNIRIENQLAKHPSTKEKRKLAKEKSNLNTELSECLSKININKLKGFYDLKNQPAPKAIPPGQLNRYIDELLAVWERLINLEPEIKEARQKLIQGNLRLVVSICRHYRNRAVSFRDLIQEGNLGLIKAVEKFDYKKGFRLNTYASWWIREGINRAIEEKSRVIRIPVYVNEKFYKIKKAAKSMLQDDGKESTFADLACKLKMPPQEIARIIEAFKEPLSLETSQTGDVDPLETFLSDNQPSPIERISKEIIKEKAASIICSLPEREASILSLRFGLGDEGEKTLEEVGAIYNVSRERVRQLENNALRKLRRNKELKTLLSLLATS